jgi:acetyl esterase/lipase
MTRAERDAAYNNTAAVAGVDTLHAARAQASEQVRAAAPRGLDLCYGTLPRNRIDVFPASNPAAPCLVFLHGGYWQMNSKESFACLGDGVRTHGWAAAFPGYTLAPDASLTQIAAEIDAALDWLRDAGPAHGIACPLVVAGWSAGGLLAALALRHPSVIAGLGISGIYELAPLRDTYLNDRLALSDEQIAALSPLRLPVVHKPFAIAYGAAELPALILNSVAFNAHRVAAGAPGPLLVADGANHFTILSTLREADSLLTQGLVRLRP